MERKLQPPEPTKEAERLAYIREQFYINIKMRLYEARNIMHTIGLNDFDKGEEVICRIDNDIDTLISMATAEIEKSYTFDKKDMR